MTAQSYEEGDVNSAVLGLQEMVYERLRRLPVAFADLDIDAQATFCEATEKHVNFELEHDTVLFIGMVLLAQGDGYFMLENPDNDQGLTVRHMTEGDTLFGFIEHAYVRPVQSCTDVIARRPTILRDLQISVLLELGEAMYESGDKAYDLSQKYLTYIPLAYPGLRYDENSMLTL